MDLVAIGKRLFAIPAYQLSVLVTALVTAVKLASPTHFGFERPFFFYFIPVVIVSLTGSVRAALLTLAVVLVLLTYIFLPPHYSFGVDSRYYQELVVFILQALFIIWLATRMISIHRKHKSLNRELEHKVQQRTRELEKQSRELMVLNKSINQFASLASHQLRTPATGVKLYIELLLEGYGGGLTEMQKSMLLSAQESNIRQLQTIDDMLRVSREYGGKIKLERRPTDLKQLIQDVITELESNLKSKNQTISFAFAEKDMIANVDADKITMVIENMLDNAIKYTPPDKNIHIKMQKRTGIISISIADQGVGIKKDDIPHLFKQFVRIENPLSSKVGGTGLGLYWAKKIINLHKGNISVTSQSGKGSTFVITLPG